MLESDINREKKKKVRIHKMSVNYYFINEVYDLYVW